VLLITAADRWRAHVGVGLNSGTIPMKRASHLLIALVALSSAAGSARAIDCNQAAGRLDGIICSDPEMRDYHGRIAAAYGRALAVWDGAIAPYVQREQQEWLIAFRTIETVEAAIDDDCVLSDRDCIRAEMRRRVDDMESGAYIHSGVYQAANGMKLLLEPGVSASYRVRVYNPARLPKVDNVTLLAERSAQWKGTQLMISAMGDANGLPLPEGDGCTLELTPQPLAIHVAQTGSCQGNRFEGTYSRLLGETLRSYELELH
jgi:uncharacterized protein YecT (DUF1311 family)